MLKQEHTKDSPTTARASANTNTCIAPVNVAYCSPKQPYKGEHFAVGLWSSHNVRPTRTDDIEFCLFCGTFHFYLMGLKNHAYLLVVVA